MWSKSYDYVRVMIFKRFNSISVCVENFQLVLEEKFQSSPLDTDQTIDIILSTNHAEAFFSNKQGGKFISKNKDIFLEFVHKAKWE